MKDRPIGTTPATHNFGICEGGRYGVQTSKFINQHHHAREGEYSESTVHYTTEWGSEKENNKKTYKMVGQYCRVLCIFNQQGAKEGAVLT